MIQELPSAICEATKRSAKTSSEVVPRVPGFGCLADMVVAKNCQRPRDAHGVWAFGMLHSLRLLIECHPEERARGLPGIEIFLCKRKAGLRLVVGGHHLDAVSSLLQVSEMDHAGGVRQEMAGSGVLDDYRLATREVAPGAVTDPRIREPNTGLLDRAELSARAVSLPDPGCERIPLLGDGLYVPGRPGRQLLISEQRCCQVLTSDAWLDSDALNFWAPSRT